MSTRSFPQTVIPVMFCLHKRYFCKSVIPTAIYCSTSSGFSQNSSSAKKAYAGASINTVQHRRCITTYAGAIGSSQLLTFYLNGVSSNTFLRTHLRHCLPPRLKHSSSETKKVVRESGNHKKCAEDATWKSSNNSVPDSELDLTDVHSKNLTIAALGQEDESRCSTFYQDENQLTPTDNDDNEDYGRLVPKATGDEISLPELSRTAYNVVPYVSRSETLQKLLQLGVDLDRVQKVQGMSELLIKSNFEKDIIPYIQFLSILGVDVTLMGYVLSRHPRIFTQPLEELEATVGYLLSKKFSLPEVASMVSRAPVMLFMSPVQMDEKLGFYQKTFDLSGDEVRQVAVKHPRLLPWRREKIADVRFHVKEFLGFSNGEMKTILLKAPKVFMSNKHHLEKRFDYLHNTMLISHKQIVQWPSILRHRAHIVKQRHLFLLSLGLAQYDPCKENYVSMQALVTGTDQIFCENIAKSNFSDFVKFLKTL